MEIEQGQLRKAAGQGYLVYKKAYFSETYQIEHLEDRKHFIYIEGDVYDVFGNLDSLKEAVLFSKQPSYILLKVRMGPRDPVPIFLGLKSFLS